MKMSEAMDDAGKDEIERATQGQVRCVLLCSTAQVSLTTEALNMDFSDNALLQGEKTGTRGADKSPPSAMPTTKR